MPHTLDRDDQHRVVDCINHPVISHSNSKSVFAPLQFPAARWSRIGSEILDCPKHSPLNYRSEPAQIFLRRPAKLNDVERHSFSDGASLPRAGWSAHSSAAQ
jgi:hypothetical protein